MGQWQPSLQRNRLQLSTTLSSSSIALVVSVWSPGLNALTWPDVSDTTQLINMFSNFWAVTKSKPCQDPNWPKKTIGLDDFLPHLWTISQAPDPGCYEEFFEGLKVFDKDGSGKVSANELRHVLTQLGEKLDSKDCDKLLDGHEDADDNVKYDHFIKTILSDKEEAKE